ALVDSKNQVIIHAEAFGNGQDHHHVPPMLEGAKENMESIGQSPDYFKATTFTADSNYHSKENMQKCIDEELDAYIPDRAFRTRDPRFAGQERYGHQMRTRYGLDDFHYDKKRDQYECPNGKRLSLKVKSHRCTGNLYRIFGAQEQDCKGCMLRGKCLNRDGHGPRTLSVPIGPDGVNLTKLMIEKIESEQGRKIYQRRMAIVEPVFANLRIHKRLDRFTLRGKIKVNIQWKLYCMVHNIEKIANYGFA
ncbi:MAG: transposase, partial [Syntrophales bacterium LBB04]|nr:transposase [Syntrophales bacterium LBB04]